MTGAAGFIGSHVCEELLSRDVEVVGVDCFTDAYSPALKRDNLRTAQGHERFTFHEQDLRTTGFDTLLDGVDVVFHLAAIPGVRASWDEGFRTYLEHNVLATQRLLEAVRGTGTRFVYASSSSVYGNARWYPCRESDPKRPHSPYGVSKLSGEHLCETYADAFGVHTVSLRYFTVYGPRQRPDMGFHRLIEASLGRGEFTMFGDGSHVRDLTYVGDVVDATIAAGTADVPPSEVFNIAGGSQATLAEVIDIVEDIVGEPVPLKRGREQPGDVKRTGGHTELAREHLGWEPTVGVEEGLARQVEWHRNRAF